MLAGYLCFFLVTLQDKYRTKTTKRMKITIFIKNIPFIVIALEVITELII
jgi:hypothetical protein